MTTITPDLARDGGYRIPPSGDNYLNHSRGFLSWALTLDHKRIGILYLFSVLTAFFVGGLFAMLVRTQLLSPTGLLFHSTTTYDVYKSYNQMFTLHGAIMIFLVLIPGIPGALGNFVLPVMLGAKDVAFPRLNLFSFYLYVTGALFAVLSIAIKAVDTGWTFYTPYSASSEHSDTAVSWMVFGVFILGFSSILTGMNFIVTIHKLRPPGMTWFRMPLFLWAIYATSIIQVLATPVLGITLLLLMMERILHVGIFNPAYGGDPVLFQHFFWFYSHPAVYIMVLPAMGVMSEVIATFSRKHIFGYKFIALSSIAIAIIGFLVWGHHMFPNGQSTMLGTIFSFLTMLVAIPSAIKVWNWLATMYKGSIQLSTPMCYALSFLFLFTIGGLTGVFLGTLSVDVHLHDTYFVVAHFHYVMFGGTLIGFMAGIHYWWPKIWGKMYNETWGRIGCALVFIGFNTTFLPQFVMGSQGMPRRYATYDPMFTPYHVMSSIGAYIQLLGFLIAAFTLIQSLFGGKKAPTNPWGAATLEWSCSSPPPHDNFKVAPTVGDPYDHSQLIWNEKEQGYVRDEKIPARVGHQ
ncbi:MAG TPA: cytochrome c oxidase subunit I [Phycisphaerae bacterium]|jgi:cytochrome c oxidase subunit 1|nr:cytochrome c oxidase subunit I [Phycisphaerae bacterium]